MSHEHDYADNNDSSNPTFDSILTKRVSRRDMFGGMAGAAALAAVGDGGEQRERPGERKRRRQRLRR